MLSVIFIRQDICRITKMCSLFYLINQSTKQLTHVSGFTPNSIERFSYTNAFNIIHQLAIHKCRANYDLIVEWLCTLQPKTQFGRYIVRVDVASLVALIRWEYTYYKCK